MCGIAGSIALKSNSARLAEPLDRIAERMAQSISHRGPDGSGVWKSACGRVALAHRRLAIIDLTDTGRQPMAYAERFWITFNGEIYNFHCLRSELRSLGHAFRGESDTEVLLAAVAQWGVADALRRCVGMFAFALWDEREQVLHLARDRLGEKPLYLGEVSGHLFFSSELRAFGVIPGFDARINAGATNAYLRDGCVPGPHSIYSGVYKLPPGHWITVAAGRDQRLPPDWPRASGSSNELAPCSYWSCRDAAFRGAQEPITDPMAAIDKAAELLRDSVRSQMHADVPTGAFLSGGIDSSLVTAVMQSQSQQAVRTFTVAFDDPRFDESRHARAIAAHLGTQHTEFVLREQEIVDQVPSIAHCMDEPTANGSFFPVYLISRLARSEVTVVLSGDGGDELFAGYNRYVLAPKAWRRAQLLPGPLRRLLGRILAADGGEGLSRLIAKGGHFGSQVVSSEVRRKLARVLMSRTFAETYLRLTSFWTDPSLLQGRFALPPRDMPERFAADLASMLLADQLNYLPDDNLAKVDRASMATSLETRLPLLDHRLVEFSWHLPADQKLRGLTTKWLLRQILDRYVPRSLIERPKMGFSVPIDQWLRGPLRAWAADLLHGAQLSNILPIRPGAAGGLWSEYLAGRGPSANEVWAVVMLAAWCRRTTASGTAAHAPPAAAHP